MNGSKSNRSNGSSPKHNNRVMEMVRIIDDTQGFEDKPRICDDVSPTLRSQRSGLKTLEKEVCRIEDDNFYLSEKGKKYVCDPKRGMCTDINPNLCITLTANGQSNWTGSFVSPDIERLEKPKTIGSTEATKIHLKNGEVITSKDDLTQYRIRKLTPKECWRLMDFTDEDFDKAAEVNSNTQLYKQAGNSIVVNVLEAILGQMIPGKEDVYKTR